ncbi:MAG: acyl-CoA/acyl-ACP dehydrogenase [Spirochaetaceae bacterium]|nr:acyl-CoA/acyl-ACP dehydrogenase [Myxococcales bacterium]MCB9722724.1 acyl-CoA/acyl-ACP dehydrogenase [Spirochaetaceae bacterium]
MDLDFSEEQDMLRDMVRNVCAEYSPVEVVRALENDEKGYPDELWKQLVELGLVGILIPEALGGQGQTLLEAAILYEELGRVLAPTPHFVSAVLCAGAIERAGSETQKSEWLPRIASGEAILTPAWLEPRSGYLAKGVQLRAEPSGDGFVLRGSKLHVSFAGAATRLLVLARTGDAEEAIDLFLVDPKAAGVAISQRQNLGSETTFRVDLDGVRVAVSDRVGAPGSGWATWHAVMLDGIVLAAAQAAGGASAALEMTVDYAKTREQFGKPLGAFQAISHYLADGATAIEGGRNVVYEAAWSRSVGKDVSALAPMAKLFMCGAFRDLTATCQQVWGGVGFTIEYDIQLYFRRAKQLQMSWYDERALSELVARQVLD